MPDFLHAHTEIVVQGHEDKIRIDMQCSTPKNKVLNTVSCIGFQRRDMTHSLKQIYFTLKQGALQIDINLLVPFATALQPFRPRIFTDQLDQRGGAMFRIFKQLLQGQEGVNFSDHILLVRARATQPLELTTDVSTLLCQQRVCANTEYIRINSWITNLWISLDLLRVFNCQVLQQFATTRWRTQAFPDFLMQRCRRSEL